MRSMPSSSDSSAKCTRMPRAGLSNSVVVAAAADLSDEVGYDGLTLAALADGLGVRLPSLYKHIEGLPALQRQLSVQAKSELAIVLAKATSGRSNKDALMALATAYRRWARAHPGRYAASLKAPDLDDPNDVAASEAAGESVYHALRGYDLDEETLIDSVRTLRAIIGGYLALELQGGFGLDRPVEDSLDWALDSLHEAMSR